MKSRLFIVAALCLAVQMLSLPTLAQTKMNKNDARVAKSSKKTGNWINHGSKNINHWFNGTSKKINKGTNKGSKEINHTFQGKK